MNLLLKFIFLSAFCLSLPSYSDTMVRGINYDPVHSVAFAQGVGTDNQQLMQQAVMDDLNKLKDLNAKGFTITHLKTFFTQYNSLNNRATINMADVVYRWNQENPETPLTLALGIYEFRPKIDACLTEEECQQWTQAQIEVVKQALSDYNANQIALIDRIIIGNEDLDTSGMDKRIVNDINQIKQYIKQNAIKNVTVGTAQTQPTVINLYNGTKYQTVLDAADFIGINVYPFWSNIPYGNKGVTAKAAFTKVWQDLKKSKNWGKKPLIETEEGWPSAGNANATLDNEYDYFYYWFYGHTLPDQSPKPGLDYLVQTSYYFALEDKLPNQGIESNWGLFSADNSSNILDNNETGGKKLDDSLIFPVLNNFIGADLNQHLVYNLKNLHKITITACTESNGQGTCYPLYGFQGSGVIKELSVDKSSWDAAKNGYTRFNPDTSKFMVDTSTHYYKSLLFVLDDGNYPGICWVNVDSLIPNNPVNIVWKDQDKPQAC